MLKDIKNVEIEGNFFMRKDVYELGEHPELGEIPKYMYAQVIRETRFGIPTKAFLIEKIQIPKVGSNDVLVYIMAAGVNYNNVFAASGKPVNLIEWRKKRGESEDFHIGGSDASGIVWKVGSNVKNVKIGDEVVIHCGRWNLDDPFVKAGKDPALAPSQHIWGYESNYGSFAQYALVQEHQCLPKPKQMSWEEASCYMLVAATAYRMLHGWPGNTLKKGDPVLIWGGSGGLGSFAIQIAKIAGAKPVAVVSDSENAKYCLDLGAVGVINRKDFNHWGTLAKWENGGRNTTWLKEAKRFGKTFWKALGEKKNPVIVCEHPGEKTIPTSTFLVERGGMVVICGGTTGYIATVDLRYHWMQQKRLQGSHFANTEQCQTVNQFAVEGKLNPCLSRVFNFEETGLCHQLMSENKHPPGKMSILVNAVKPGLKTWR